jgi:class 3 adenylate cyclase
MFCDIVDFSRLSDLDPEDLKKIVNEYHKACEHVLHEFDAFAAEKLGDGLVAYFGWPVAPENEARRAGRASLRIVKAIKALNPGLKRDYGISLEVRIGVDSGTVVVEKVGDVVHATGKPPTVPARLQTIANPDTAVISSTTFNLVHRYFDCEDLGVRSLKGIAQASRAYRVVAEREIERRTRFTWVS